MTALGQLSLFSDFLKTAEVLEAFVAEHPLRYTRQNAPEARDVLGRAMPSILSGHTRHAHIAALREDVVAFGHERKLREAGARRAFAAIESRVQLHLDDCAVALLATPSGLYGGVRPGLRLGQRGSL